MFRIGLKSPKSFVLRFINYYLKSVWETFPVSMSKHQYPVCAFISLDFLEIVQWTSQFLHTWVNLTTNNTGYSGVIICKWDWMCVWLYSTVNLGVLVARRSPPNSHSAAFYKNWAPAKNFGDGHFWLARTSYPYCAVTEPSLQCALHVERTQHMVTVKLAGYKCVAFFIYNTIYREAPT